MPATAAISCSTIAELVPATVMRPARGPWPILADAINATFGPGSSNKAMLVAMKAIYNERGIMMLSPAAPSSGRWDGLASGFGAWAAPEEAEARKPGSLKQMVGERGF